MKLGDDFMSSLLRKLDKNSKGQILPMIALGMAVFLGFAAISVDYGYLAWQRRSLQNAADSGALAAAWELPNPGEGAPDQDTLDDKAEQYTNEHVSASFKSATPIKSNKAVTVVVEKDYDRIFFSRIFKFFDENAPDSDRLSAEATAERFVYYWDGLLPFASLEKFDEELDEETGEYFDRWESEKNNYFSKWSSAESFVEEQDYLSYDETIVGKVRIDETDSTGKELYKENIDYFDLFMGTLKNKTIDFRQVSDISSANYGQLFLPTEEDPDGAQPLHLIRGTAGRTINIVNVDIGFKMGWVDAIENPGGGQPDLSDKLDELGNKGYIIAVLPDKVDLTAPNGDKLAKWGDYLILELENIEINYDGNKVDKENPVSGKLVDSYNIYRGEIPNVRFSPEMRLGSVLIKP